MNAQGVLALVPARGGSKSLPGKNRRIFAGHPLVAYSVAAGQQASSVDRVIVSTDDERIADIGRQYGAEVPFLRPPALARDDTLDLPVFEHALEWLAEQEGYRPEIVVQLRPTSPVRPPDCVDRAVALLRDHHQASSVRGVVPSGQNPYKMWREGRDGALQPLLESELPEPYNQPRQALPQTYWQTGHIDAIRVETILGGSMSGPVVFPLELPPEYAVDIDNPVDWSKAEWRVTHEPLPMVWPGRAPRPLPDRIELVVLDFDGVLTDNRVWVDEHGVESVAANRSDGWGIGRLRAAGFEMLVLSTEPNPVVEARCAKLGIENVHGVRDKGGELQRILEQRGLNGEQVIFLGNDENDLPCFPLVGCALVVADAHPAARSQADIVLSRKGGYGAVRELTDLLLSRVTEKESDG